MNYGDGWMGGWMWVWPLVGLLVVGLFVAGISRLSKK